MEEGHLKISIDGNELMAKEGQSVVEAAKTNGVYIPTLCDFKSLVPAGTCRVCTVKVGGRLQAGCTTRVQYGMVIESETPEIQELRKGIIEMLFVEGNHMCPSCEKSGDCELQALAYRYQVAVSRFPFSFPNRKIDATLPHLLIEHNRCIQCQRCVRGVKAKDGHDLFGFVQRGSDLRVTVDRSCEDASSEQTAQKAMDICPVGALIKKRTAYRVPIGERKYDRTPIGSDIEKKEER